MSGDFSILIFFQHSFCKKIANEVLYFVDNITAKSYSCIKIIHGLIFHKLAWKTLLNNKDAFEFYL